MNNGACVVGRDRPAIVGSFGGVADLAGMPAGKAGESCDLAEIRLDLIADSEGRIDRSSWAHLHELPLLFTARRAAEGGSGDFSDSVRQTMLESVLDDAACIDIEVASVDAMAGLIEQLAQRKLPWIASFHDFDRLPADAVLATAAAKALEAGAAVFKAAARLHGPGDLARLAEFQLRDHGLPVATMGMGPLAPVSRLLCAQCGSVLNYGFLGSQPTAPGQWDAATLRHAVSRLEPWRG
jgi:3-dehydroquinate dehydratase I